MSRPELLEPTTEGGVRYPSVEAFLTGATNVFDVVGRVSGAMRRAGVAQDDIEAFAAQALCTPSSSVTELCARWVAVR